MKIFQHTSKILLSLFVWAVLAAPLAAEDKDLYADLYSNVYNDVYFNAEEVVSEPQQTLNSMAFANGDGYPVTFTGSQDTHSTVVGDYIFVADNAANEIRLYSYSAGFTLEDTYDVSTIAAPNDAVNVADHVYKINDTTAGWCDHAAGDELIFDVTGGTLTLLGVKSGGMGDTSGTANTAFLTDNLVLRYTGGSAVPEQIQAYSWDTGTETFSTSGNAYTGYETSGAALLIGLSETKAAIVDATNKTIYTIERTGDTWAAVGNTLTSPNAIDNDTRPGAINETTIVFSDGGSRIYPLIWDATREIWKRYRAGINLTSFQGPSDLSLLNSTTLIAVGDYGANSQMKAIDITIGDIIENPIEDLASEFYQITDYSRASLTGTTMTAWTDEKGNIDLEAIDTPTYVAAFNNAAGSLRCIQNTDGFRYASNFAATATQTIGFVIDLDTYTSDLTIFSFATGTGDGDTDARIVHTGVGDLGWASNEAAGTTSIFTSASDDIKLIILRFNSTGSLDAFVNSATPTNLDPDDAYSTHNRLRFGNRAGTDTDTGSDFGEIFRANSALSNSDISDIMDYWALKYGVTLL